MVVPILTVGIEFLTHNYGLVTKEQARAAAVIYQNARGRNAQNSEMLFKLLSKSIPDKVLAMTNTDMARFVLVIGQAMVCDGMCFLKSIVDHTYMSTRLNTAAARGVSLHLTEKWKDCQ